MSLNSPEIEIDKLMRAAIDDLEVAAAAHTMNHFEAKLLGAVSDLLGYADILKRVETQLAKLSAADLFENAITNVDWHNLSADELDRLRSIEPAAKFAADHPVLDRNAPDPNFERFAQESPHLKLCLQGDIGGAIGVVKSDLDYEEIACTLAALGKFDEAVALIDSLPVPDYRRRGVRFVVLIEKCRRLFPTFPSEINSFAPKGFDRLHTVLALAQRRPWSIYPYPDW